MTGTCPDLQAEHNSHRQEVEAVVDCGPGEGSLEGFWVSGLGEGDEGVGQRGPDVGSHDHRDSVLHTQNWKVVM